MQLQDALKKLDLMEQMRARYEYALGILHYDGATVSPPQATSSRGDCMALLSQESYQVFVNDETGEMLEFLKQNTGELDRSECRRVEILSEEYDKIKCIPMQEYVAFSVLCNEAESVWETAREDNDFSRFQPYLDNITDTLKRFAGYVDPTRDPYELWLDEHEKGLTREICDNFFSTIKQSLVPLIHSIGNAQPVDTSAITGYFSAYNQKLLSQWLTSLMGIPAERSTMGESAHPFTIGLNRNDVRLTTKYHEDNPFNAIYSTIHESGHALYELGAAEKLMNTCISGPRSTAVHESQSRFFENYIGRSKPFLTLLLPKLTELFPDVFGSLDIDRLYPIVNRVQPSLIRIEADELTYSLHIMVRYEIEKLLFDSEIKVSELPDVWRTLYHDYLGVEVPDDSRGVLQDVHWSSGMMGYFPSYSLGSAYAAQIYNGMQKDLDVDTHVISGDFSPIVSWLTSKFYLDAGIPTSDEILIRCSGQPFDPSFYIRYLTDKYSTLFGLQD